MRFTVIVSAGVLCPALVLAPVVTTLLVVLLLASGSALLCWFARQPRTSRRDIVELVRALRGN